MKTIQLNVNGKPFDFTGLNVSDLVTQMALSERRIAIELNEEILPKSEYDDTRLKAGDCLEIIHAIGGG